MSKGSWGVLLGTAVVTTGIGGIAYLSQNEEPEPPTVVRVIDGDTVDIRIDGEVERVRLLNVDTPETKHPQREIECLGPEATEFLS